MASQVSLFGQPPAKDSPPSPIPSVKGLTYRENYISQTEHDELLCRIDLQRWLNDLKRRVQHYGYKYDYRARKIDESMSLGHLPSWLQSLSERLHKDDLIQAIPDQVIVNEYLPGQGISDHVDCEPCFADTIISLSLGSSCAMNFTHKDTDQKESVWLEPRSIVIMRGESRYNWKHGIPARKSDVHNGQRIQRTRRVSLTFRRVILDDTCQIT